MTGGGGRGGEDFGDEIYQVQGGGPGREGGDGGGRGNKSWIIIVLPVTAVADDLILGRLK